MGTAIPEIDVFLSYRHVDKDQVLPIALALRDRFSLKVWWDTWNIPAGSQFQTEIESGLESSKVYLVFVGPSDIAGWQDEERQSALVLAQKYKRPLIPALLPGVPEDTRLPALLETRSKVFFKEGVTDDYALNGIAASVERERRRYAAPPTPAPPPPAFRSAPSSALDDTIDSLIDFLDMSAVTFFVGHGLSHGSADSLPRTCEVTRALLTEHLAERGLDVGASKLLPSIDSAANYWAVWRNDILLEQKVRRLRGAGPGAGVSTMHAKLALMISRLDGANRRGQFKGRQLIVSTTQDLLIERALLRAGVKFLRVVQVRGSEKLQVNDYTGPTAIPGGDAELDAYISRERRALADKDSAIPPDPADPAQNSGASVPVLYKFCGSHDVPGSCALTSSHFMETLRSVIKEQRVPEKITSILSNTPLVFLGIGLLEPEFQLAGYSLLNEAFSSSYPKYLIQPSPENDPEDCYRLMEVGIWHKIVELALRRNINVIEESPGAFLEAFLQKLGA